MNTAELRRHNSPSPGVLHCSYGMLDFYFRSAGENCLIAVEGQLCAF